MVTLVDSGRNLNLEHLSILVVDDSRPMHLLLRQILAAMRIKNVTFCDTVEQARHELRGNLPDLLITDWFMEPEDGLVLVEWLRKGEDSPNPYLPIILLTAYAGMDEVIKARDAGVTEILAKPVSIEALYKRICMIVEEPRPYVKTEEYFGPDRRRSERAYVGEDRRKPQNDS